MASFLKNVPFSGVSGRGIQLLNGDKEEGEGRSEEEPAPAHPHHHEAQAQHGQRQGEEADERSQRCLRETSRSCSKCQHGAGWSFFSTRIKSVNLTLIFQKMSKIETLLVAQTYIKALAKLMDSVADEEESLHP